MTPRSQQYYSDNVACLKVCEVDQAVLPATEQAENLGYGLWLITSANPIPSRPRPLGLLNIRDVSS